MTYRTERLQDRNNTRKAVTKLFIHVSKEFMKTINPGFKHNQLNFDFEKLMDYDTHKIVKCNFVSDGRRWYTLDINDSSYIYNDSHERNKDYKTAKQTFTK